MSRLLARAQAVGALFARMIQKPSF